MKIAFPLWKIKGINTQNGSCLIINTVNVIKILKEFTFCNRQEIGNSIWGIISKRGQKRKMKLNRGFNICKWGRVKVRRSHFLFAVTAAEENRRRNWLELSPDYCEKKMWYTHRERENFPQLFNIYRAVPQRERLLRISSTELTKSPQPLISLKQKLQLCQFYLDIEFLSTPPEWRPGKNFFPYPWSFSLEDISMPGRFFHDLFYIYTPRDESIPSILPLISTPPPPVRSNPPLLK